MSEKTGPLPLIAGNWKMNGTVAGYAPFLTALAAEIAPESRKTGDQRGAGDQKADRAEVLICPPAPLLGTCTPPEGIGLGAQDCHHMQTGAHTGDIPAGLLAALGCRYVILGHSERRRDHGESAAQVKAKAGAALAAGLGVIICVGETRAERESGQATRVVLDQLAASIPDPDLSAGTGGEGVLPQQLVIAYEPVWAIGTGLTAGRDDIGEMHAAIRAALNTHFASNRDTGNRGAGVRILYGGSVKAANAGEIFRIPNVNGALVGGASLSVAGFAPIIATMNGLHRV